MIHRIFAPHLEGVQEDGFCITDLFDKTSDLSRELANFDLTSFRSEHLTTTIQLHNPR